MMQAITYTPIGVIRSPFTELAGMPIQTVAAAGVAATVELDPSYAAGLADIDEFSYLLLITHLHLMQGFALEVTPFMDTQPHGVFATRSPRRPNPIGLTVVELVERDGRLLRVRGGDMLDGTPILDLKPYLSSVPEPGLRRGWLADAEARSTPRT